MAAIAPFSEQGIEVRDAKELRVKESDRITAIVDKSAAHGRASGRAGRRPENSRRPVTARRRN